MKIRGFWKGLQWSEHSELDMPQVLKACGENMEFNIEKLNEEFENATKWVKYARVGFLIGIIAGTETLIVILTC